MLEALGLIAAGLLLAGAAAVLLRLYRGAFFHDPRAIMSLEVVLQVLRMGGPGYLALLCMLGGVWLFAAGLYMLVAELLLHLRAL